MLLVFGLNLLALAAFCLSLARHHRDLFGSAPSERRQRLLRVVGCVDGGLGLAYAIHCLGVELGIVYWACLLMAAGALLVALLAWRPSWTLATVAGVPLLGGVVALFA
ncbi:MAG: hypothetical protein GAK45_00784 [Pseudomonas citronellolis]|nr:MAG: hypothetical protein GAK45_00784 [Pseudomonas citronellolis]